MNVRYRDIGLLAMVFVFVGTVGMVVQADEPASSLQWVGRLGALSFRHDARISAVLETSDRKGLLSADQTGKVRLWDLRTGKLVREFLPPKRQERHDHFSRLSLSADQKVLTAHSSGPNARRPMLMQWDYRTGKLLNALSLRRPNNTASNPSNSVRTVVPLSDGKRVLVGSGQANSYSGKKGEEPKPPPVKEHLLLWDALSRKILKTWTFGPTAEVRCIVPLTGEKQVWIGIRKEVILIDLDRSEPIRRFTPTPLDPSKPDGQYKSGYVFWLKLINGGKRLLVGRDSHNGSTLLVDSQTGKTISEPKRTSRLLDSGYLGHKSNPISVRPDLALTPQMNVGAGNGPGYPSSSANTLSRDRKHIYAAFGNAINRFDSVSGKRIALPGQAPYSGEAVQEMIFLPKSQRLMVFPGSTYGNRYAQLWDMSKRTLQPLPMFSSREGQRQWGRQGRIQDVCPVTERMVVCDSQITSVGSVDAEKPEQIKFRWPWGTRLRSAVFTPDGKHILAINGSGQNLKTWWKFPVDAGGVKVKIKPLTYQVSPCGLVDLSMPSKPVVMAFGKIYDRSMGHYRTRNRKFIRSRRAYRATSPSIEPGIWVASIVPLEMLGKLVSPDAKEKQGDLKVAFDRWRLERVWMWHSVREPKQVVWRLCSVPYLTDQKIDKKRLDGLIEQLDSDKYKTRQAADQALRESNPAEARYLRTIKSASAETRMRLAEITKFLTPSVLRPSVIAQGKLNVVPRYTASHPDGVHWAVVNHRKLLLGGRQRNRLSVLETVVLPSPATAMQFLPNGKLLIGTAAGTVEIYKLQADNTAQKDRKG